MTSVDHAHIWVLQEVGNGTDHDSISWADYVVCWCGAVRYMGSFDTYEQSQLWAPVTEGD